MPRIVTVAALRAFWKLWLRLIHRSPRRSQCRPCDHSRLRIHQLANSLHCLIDTLDILGQRRALLKQPLDAVSQPAVQHPAVVGRLLRSLLRLLEQLLYILAHFNVTLVIISSSSPSSPACRRHHAHHRRDRRRRDRDRHSGLRQPYALRRSPSARKREIQRLRTQTAVAHTDLHRVGACQKPILTPVDSVPSSFSASARHSPQTQSRCPAQTPSR